MRVTQKILFNNFMRDVHRNRTEMGKIQSDLSSGRFVRVPSHDPVNFQRARIIEENVRKEDQYLRNISHGLRQARFAQESLARATDSLIEIKEVLVQGATDSADAHSRESMAEQVSAIRNSLINTFNVNYGDRFLFAGTNSATPPFELDPGDPSGVAYHGNGSAPTVMAGDRIQIGISVSGEDLRTMADGGDIFQVITDIEQALRDSDRAALNNLMPDLDNVINHVTYETSKLASNINQLDYMIEQYEALAISQKSDVSQMVDTDYGDAFSRLQRNQVAYESALAVHTTMFQNSLLDFIKI